MKMARLSVEMLKRSFWIPLVVVIELLGFAIALCLIVASEIAHQIGY